MSKFRLGETAGIEIEYDNISINSFPDELVHHLNLVRYLFQH